MASAAKPLSAALKKLETASLRPTGPSSSRYVANMGILDPRPMEDDMPAERLGDVAEAKGDIFRSGPKRNPAASTSVKSAIEFPEEDSIMKGVIYGFLLGASFFLLTRYIKRKYFAAL
jgi:hypothetical protein